MNTARSLESIVRKRPVQQVLRTVYFALTLFFVCEAARLFIHRKPVLVLGGLACTAYCAGRLVEGLWQFSDRLTKWQTSARRLESDVEVAHEQR
jgi:hypothetical protein